MKLYTLEVYITNGPMSQEFIVKNQVVLRIIEIRGDQTLEDLHCAIFNAFDREEEHLYEFQIGGKGQMILTLLAIVHLIHLKVRLKLLNQATMQQIKLSMH